MTPRDRRSDQRYREDALPGTPPQECVGRQLQIPTVIDVWDDAGRWERLARACRAGTP